MSKPTIVIGLTLAVLLLVGCGSPTTVTRMAAKNMTMVALGATDATVADAQKIVTIAVMVKTSVDGGFDPADLHMAVLEALANAFDGNQKLIYISIADDILTLIEDEIEFADPPLQLGQAGIYVNAAALGVEQGSRLYILLIESGDP